MEFWCFASICIKTIQNVDVCSDILNSITWSKRNNMANNIDCMIIYGTNLDVNTPYMYVTPAATNLQPANKTMDY